MKMYSTFPSGMETIIEGIVKKYATIVQVLNGAMIYETDRFRELLSIPCFNNHFQILYMKKGSTTPNKCIADLLRNRNLLNFQGSKQSKTFRIMVSDQNNLVSVDKKLKMNMETLIKEKTGLLVDRALADEEFWILTRSENLYLFMQRMNNHAHKSYDKILQKGALKPEITYIMNILSCPTSEDVYLDPFAGSGALGISRFQHFGLCKKIYMFDSDEDKVDQLRHTVQGRTTPYDIRKVDIRNIHQVIPCHSITNIVTDPPWGYFEKKDNIREFYVNMLSQFQTILAPEAHVTVLTSRDADFNEALEYHSVNDCQQHHILLSGKKATIHVLRMR